MGKIKWWLLLATIVGVTFYGTTIPVIVIVGEGLDVFKFLRLNISDGISCTVAAVAEKDPVNLEVLNKYV